MKYNTISILSLFVFGLFFTSSCADAIDDEGEAVSQEFDISRSGRWRPPTSIEQTAKGYSIRRVTAGRWRGTSSCSPSGTYTPAMANLKKFIESTYPQVSNTGGYNCRHIRGNPRATSVHATGRALDIHIPLHRGLADNDKGDPIANYLLANAQQMGIQTIIWDESIWTSSRANLGVRYYSGTHRHRDHLHIEITTNGPTSFVDKTCNDVITETGGTIDNTSTCFETFGSQRYWRTENNGHGGTLLWTNATRSTAPQNWARWNLNFAETGTYKVLYHSTSAFAKFNATKYKVKSGQKTTDITVDQSAGQDGWVELGIFDFVQGKDQWVTVADNSPNAVPSGQHIVADAIRLEPALKPGCTDTIKEEGGIIDNTSECFETFGNQKYWRSETAGYDGGLLWTNATKSSAAQNWARWNLNFEKEGRYKVFYHSTEAFAKFNSTKYRVKSEDSTSEITVDQSAGSDGWEELGTFDFKKGHDQWVTVADNSDGPVARGQHIVADALKLEPEITAGDLQINLSWTVGTDLDIFVRTPSGKVISGDVGGTTAADGGRLIKDSCYKDACQGDPASADMPHEEIVVWSADNYPEGEYRVWAVNFDGAAAADFKVKFTHPDGTVEEKTGSVTQAEKASSQEFIFIVKNN